MQNKIVADRVQRGVMFADAWSSTFVADKYGAGDDPLE
jgi:hypothetical protein